MRKVRYLPVILLLFFVLLIDLYAFQGVEVLAQNLSETNRVLVYAGYWLVSFGVIAIFLIGFYRSFSAGKISRGFNRVINVFLTLLVTKLVFCLVLLTEDLYRIILSFFNGGTFVARIEGLSQLGLLISAIPFFSFIYGVTRGKYNYTVHQIELFFEDLPQAFEGFKLVQISDIHAGSFTRRASVERGVRLINEQNADLFVFTGDLVNNKSEEILPWIDVFSEIRAPYGKFSILGNHDYGDYVQWPGSLAKAQNLVKLKQYHKEMGFRLLLDEHVKIRKDDAEITLSGVENWGLGFGQRGDLEKSLKEAPVNGFKILLSHDPTHWQSVVKNYPVKVHLTLSGHTHGMQFGIEALGIKWSPVQYRYPHWAGLTNENGRYLYINRGFGFLGFSGRVGIWPEITLITLRKGTV